MKTINVDWSCPDCDTVMEFEIYPGRRCPPCSNHDSPAFSDPGDPAEIVEGVDCCPACLRVITTSELESIIDDACSRDDNDPTDYEREREREREYNEDDFRKDR